MEGRYLPFIYQIGISIGCIRLLRRKQLLIDIDHLLGQCLELQLIPCQKCLISCIGTITGQCGIQQLLLTSRSRTAVIHGHIACQMHDIRSVLLSTHLIGDIEKVLDEVILLQDGKVLRQTAVDELREETGESVDAYFREVYKC